MIKEIRTSLLCSWCLKESPTLITYVGNSIVRIKCQSCGHSIRVSSETFRSYLVSDFERRALSKPMRLAREIKGSPSHFLSTFPLRAITKPLRMLREVELINS